MAGLRKILLVEDDVQIIEIYTTTLKLDGYEVAVASNYNEALQQALSFKPDLIFLDIMIPEHSGLEVLHTLRTDPQYGCQNKKMVLLSNLSENSEVKKALDSNEADGYALKAEINPHDLDKIIKSFEEHEGQTPAAAPQHTPTQKPPETPGA